VPVNPGRLRHRVEVLQGTRVNTAGGPTTNWDTLGVVWAAVVQVDASGAARYSQAGYTNVTHEVTMRAGPTLTLGRTLLKWSGRQLQPITPPTAVDHSGRFVQIACREVNDGEEQPTTSSS
jgi:head-tail adaptor